MGSLAEARPKCLIELGGRPLLEWQVAALSASGVTEIAIVTGWQKELLERRASATFHNPRWAETSMVASLACAAPWLEQTRCIVSYSDIFYSTGIVSALVAAESDIAITYDPDWLALWSRRFPDPLSDAETFRADASGFVTEIGARATSVDQIKGQYMGLLSFTPAGWTTVTAYLGTLAPAAIDRLDMTSLLSGLIGRRVPVRAVPINGRWGEVDTPSDLAIYTDDLKRGLLTFPSRHG